MSSTVSFGVTYGYAKRALALLLAPDGKVILVSHDHHHSSRAVHRGAVLR